MLEDLYETRVRVSFSDPRGFVSEAVLLSAETGCVTDVFPTANQRARKQKARNFGRRDATPPCKTVAICACRDIPCLTRSKTVWKLNTPTRVYRYKGIPTFCTYRWRLNLNLFRRPMFDGLWNVFWTWLGD